MRNCKRIPRDAEKTLQVGYAGVKDGFIYLRPDRGSGGFALYDSPEKAKEFTGCEEVTFKLRLVLERVPE